MVLRNPAILPKLDGSTVSTLCATICKSKGWRDVVILSVSLKFTPFWIFNYDTYDGKSGRGEINAIDGSLSFKYAEYTNGETSNDVSGRIDTPMIKSHEAKDVIRVKLVSSLGVGKDDVVISAINLYYVPFWVCSADLGDNTISVLVDGVSGEILTDIPEAELTWDQVLRQTFVDVFSVSGFISLVKESYEYFASDLFENSPGLKWFTNTWTGRITLFVILLLVYVLYFS